MTKPCYTCMAAQGGDHVCRLFCRLFNCYTPEATEKFCHGHKYHFSEIEYREMVFMRDTANASE